MDATHSTVEFLHKQIIPDLDVNSALSLHHQQPEPAPSPAIQDSITSLMNMAHNMEALLPHDLSIHMPDPKPEPLFQDCLSVVTGCSLKPEPLVNPPQPISMSTQFLRDVTDVSGPINLPVVNNLTSDLHRLQKYPPGENTSPCAVRDFPPLAETLPRVQKPRKTTRKPKTYSKPVASRFCHICSRMPRRGQGSATCKRMQEGFCRKIVCEQCLREQGWNYDDIAKNPGNWLCPHCADICPPRSQCHIYNRINARRKRAPQKQSASVAAALASSDLLLGPYGHLFNASQTPTTQILQPPPNFRLNLPPQYSQQ